jgi:hypothetical protein
MAAHADISTEFRVLADHNHGQVERLRERFG